MAAAVAVRSEPPKTFRKLFEPPQDICQRCKGRVYPVEKVGNINGVTFHKGCFKCSVCNATLSLRTYYTNQNVQQGDTQDKEIYCSKHAPAITAVGVDGQALGIQANIRAQNLKMAGGKMDHSSQFGAGALGLKHAVDQQSEFSRRYQMMLDKHHFNPGYVQGKAREKMLKYQEELERQYRAEEDRLMEVFLREREEELSRIDKEAKDEWEVNLRALLEKYEKMGIKPDALPLTGARGPRNSRGGSTGDEVDDRGRNVYTDHLEQEKRELQNKMTMRIKERKSALTVRLQMEEQNRTAEMVKKQSEMMMNRMKEIEDEIKQEIQEEIVVELMNENEESEVPIDMPREVIESEVQNALAFVAPARQLAPPHPPSCRRRDLFDDADAFEKLDDSVVKIAEEEQTTYTDLVYQLTGNCLTDLEKARAIYRWITVKDLNRIEFEDTVGSDTPMGLLRGIKYGTEAYHTLFMRLCSYAGLGCVEIKGHSKSVGYEPGLRIREGTFLNTWNAVQIDGDWWPIQCNWGARHLVLSKDQETVTKTASKDKIRYQFDDHYFITDPDEFIQEFWAREPEWQLLERPVTLDEFENMPFVRSVFFHCGLEFQSNMKAVLYTDDKGGCDIRIRVPADFDQHLVFHYQLRFTDKERRNDTEFNGSKLERFVFHSREDSIAVFSVHVPTTAIYFLEIFANKIDDTSKLGDDANIMTSFRLKCACKFKIICDKLAGKMHPLPNCASGEWGPSKAQRHFGLTPISHKSSVVAVDGDALVVMRLSRRLNFHCKLKMNGVEDSQLSDCVTFEVTSDMLLKVKVVPPQMGQYGLDIYARADDSAKDSRTLSHACKYLLNATRVRQPKAVAAVTAQSPPPQQVAQQQQQQQQYQSPPPAAMKEGSRSSATLPATNSVRNSSSSMPPASPRASTLKDIGPTPYLNGLSVTSIVPGDANVEIIQGKEFTCELKFAEPLKVIAELVRADSGERVNVKVAIKEEAKKAKIVFKATEPGSFAFQIYARKKKDEVSQAMRVFTYFVAVITEEEAKANKRKSKGK